MENIDSPKEEKTVEAKADAVDKKEDAPKAPVVAEPEDKKSVSPPAAKYAVVGNGETDDVILSKCVYKNAYARKSLTVHHVQRRLVELGYRDAGTDKDGWYGDLTKKAVSELQADLGIEGDGTMDAETFAAIFSGDHNVTVVID
jgi:peptidoglycan hydrolase-like protein with peptidoglycan-binding domain